MLEYFDGASLRRIIVDKVIVKETGIRVSLSAALSGKMADNLKESGQVLQFRLGVITTNNLPLYSELKVPRSLKRSSFNKSGAETRYIDFNFAVKGKDPSNTLLSPERGREYIYSLGSYDIPHSLEQYNKNNIGLSCIAIPAILSDEAISDRNLDLVLSTVPGFHFSLKEETSLTSNSKIIFESVLTGQQSFVNQAALEPIDTTINKKQTAFSHLFPSVKDNTFNFLYFVDFRRLLINNSTLFPLLSESFQEETLRQLELLTHNIQVNNNQTTKKQIIEVRQENNVLNLPPNVNTYSGQHNLEYTQDLKNTYKVNIQFLNTTISVLRRLQYCVENLKTFKSFMENVFNNPAFYNKQTNKFKLNALSFIRQDLERTFNDPEASGFPQREDYFISLISDIIFATEAFDTPMLREQANFALSELRKTISFAVPDDTSEYTFNVFFKFYDILIQNLTNVFAGTDFNLALSGQGKTALSKASDRNIISLTHDFFYELEPKKYDVRFSYFDDTAISSTSFPKINTTNFLFRRQEDMRKYYKADFVPPTEVDLSIDTDRRIIPQTTNYLSLKNIKTLKFEDRNNILFNNNQNTLTSGEYVEKNLLLVLNLLNYTILNNSFDMPVDLDGVGLDTVREKISYLLKKVYTYLNLNTGTNSAVSETTESSFSIGGALSTPFNDTVVSSPELIESDTIEEIAGDVLTDTEILYLFLNIFENFIENGNSYEVAGLNLTYKNIDTLKRRLADQPATSTRGPVALPFQLYSLLESINIVDSPLGPTAFRTTFNFGMPRAERVLRDPLFSSLLRLNFANLKEIQVLRGFKRTENGELLLGDPIFEIVPPETQPNIENRPVFCRIVNYNLNYEDQIWYLCNNNLISQPSELEYFIMTRVETQGLEPVGTSIPDTISNSTLSQQPSIQASGQDTQTEAPASFSTEGLNAGTLLVRNPLLTN